MKRTAIIFVILLLLAAPLANSLAVTPSAIYPIIEKAVLEFLDIAFSELARSTKNDWVHFIYAQGIKDVEMDLNAFDITKTKPLPVSFLLCSANPDLKAIEADTDDAKAWLEALAAAMQTHDTIGKVNLIITEEEGGYTVAFAPKVEAALEKKVAALAQKAERTFGSKTIAAAVRDYFVPVPVSVPKNAPIELTPDGYLPAFLSYVKRNELDLNSHAHIPAILYALKNVALDVSAGPENLVLTYHAPDVAELFSKSVRALTTELAYDAKAKTYNGKELHGMLTEKLDSNTIAHRYGKAKGERLTYTFSLFSLPPSVHPNQFYTNSSVQPTEIAAGALGQLQIATFLLPDYPAVAKPKNAMLLGDSKGTRCTFKVYDDGYDRCVRVFNSDTDEFVGLLYVGSGSRTTVRLPRGPHYFEVGVGTVWYGPELLFGDSAYYFRTESNIPGNRSQMTYELNTKRDGNMSAYSLDFDDIINP